MSETRCDRCRWWVPYTTATIPLGQCRGMPPVPQFLKSGDTRRLFPNTYAEDFCGEFTPKEEEKTPPPLPEEGE